MIVSLQNIFGEQFYNIFTQITGVIAVVILLYGLSQKDDIKSIKIVSVSMIFWAINYALLGLLSALLVTFIGFIRMYCSLKYKGNMWAFTMLLGLIFIAGYFSFDGTFASTLPIISSILGIVAFQLFYGLKMRFILLGSSFLWLGYSVSVENIPGIVNEVLVELIMISTIIRIAFGEDDKITMRQKVKYLISKQTGKIRPRVDFERFLIFRDRKRYLNDDFTAIYEGDERKLKSTL